MPARDQVDPAPGRHLETNYPRWRAFLNVLFITSWYPTPAYTYGGIFVREHAKAVRGAGHEVVVLHLAGPHLEPDGSLWTMKEELDLSLSEGIEAHHVFHRQVGVRGASYALYLRSAIGAYRQLGRSGFRPDVIHAHVYGAGVPAAIIATRSGIPLVLTEQFSGFPRRSLSRAEVLKARYAYKRAARALPVSRHLQEAISNYGIQAEFEVVPNAVDTSLFFRRDAEPGPKEEKGVYQLLFVGNLEPLQSKGFPTLLRALARLRERLGNWHLNVFGDGPERAECETAAASLGLSEHVTFHGARPKPVIAEVMRAADLFVLPSRFDNLPCVIVEALASGLPVVSTTVGGIPELVDERSGRLVPPDDVVALADALDHTLKEIAVFDRRTIAAAARERYSLEVIGKRLAGIYEAVLSEHRLEEIARRPPAQRRWTPIQRRQRG